jgi:hypothetical protein
VVDDGKSRHHCQNHQPEPKEHVDLVQQAGPLAEELKIFEMIFSPTRAASPHMFLGVREERNSFRKQLYQVIGNSFSTK